MQLFFRGRSDIRTYRAVVQFESTPTDGGMQEIFDFFAVSDTAGSNAGRHVPSFILILDKVPHIQFGWRPSRLLIIFRRSGRYDNFQLIVSTLSHKALQLLGDESDVWTFEAVSPHRQMLMCDVLILSC